MIHIPMPWVRNRETRGSLTSWRWSSMASHGSFIIFTPRSRRMKEGSVRKEEGKKGRLKRVQTCAVAGHVVADHDDLIAILHFLLLHTHIPHLLRPREMQQGRPPGPPLPSPVVILGQEKDATALGKITLLSQGSSRPSSWPRCCCHACHTQHVGKTFFVAVERGHISWEEEAEEAKKQKFWKLKFEKPQPASPFFSDLT